MQFNVKSLCRTAQVEILEQDVSKSTTTASGELCVIITLTAMTPELPATCSDSGILLYFCFIISVEVGYIKKRRCSGDIGMLQY